MNNTLVIAGMHRSGTSLTARWLHSCGMNLGSRLMESGIGNIDGHYEDLDFHDFHEDVFKSLNISYGGLEQTPTIKLNSYFETRLESMIAYKNTLANSWGWKDPRTCLFLNIHHAKLSNPKYLILYRPANHVVFSLWKRYKTANNLDLDYNGQDNDHYRELINGFINSWIQYNEKLLDFITLLDKKDYFLTTVEDLSNKDIQVIDWLNKSGFRLEPLRFNSIFDHSKYSYANEEPLYSEKQLAHILRINDKFLEYLGNTSAIQNTEYLLKEKNQIIAGLLVEIRKKSDIIDQQNTLINQQNTLIDEKNILIDEKNILIDEKNILIDSAISWQASWKRRTFHKWRP